MRTFPILRHLRSVPPSLLKASPKGEGVHPSQSGTLSLPARRSAPWRAAACLLLFALAAPAPGLAQTCMVDLTGRTQIWSADLTVGSIVVQGTIIVYGYGPDYAGGALSDSTFLSYTIDEVIVVAQGSDSGSLAVSLTSDLNSEDRAALRLHVCGDAFDLSAATLGNDNSYQWSDADLDWSSTTTVKLALSTPNTAPVITTTSPISVPENTTAVTTLTATDVDTGTTLTWSKNGGADADAFTLTTDGVLTFATAPDYENPTDTGSNNSYVVIVQVSDATATADLTLTVNVTDVAENQPPVITTTSRLAVPENTTAVTTLTATDADGDTLIWSKNGGVDAAKFTLTPEGVLTFATAPDFEAPTDAGSNNSYVVVVRVSDRTATADLTLIVNVTDVDEQPDLEPDPEPEPTPQLPQVTITGPASVQEGDGLVVTVHRTGATAVGLRGGVIFVDTAANGDFDAHSAFTIPPDSATGTAVEFTVQNDGVPADDRTITAYVAASYLTYEPGNPSSVTVMVTAVDTEPLVALYNATDGANWTNNTNWLTNEAISEWHGVTTNSDGRVTRLKLNNNQLTGPIPEELGNLANLLFLYLNGNNGLTGTIPPELENLSNLQVFDVRNTGLSCVTAGSELHTWLATINSRGAVCGTTPPDLPSPPPPPPVAAVGEVAHQERPRRAPRGT